MQSFWRERRRTCRIDQKILIMNKIGFGGSENTSVYLEYLGVSDMST
jgi:hypothetical protein